MGDEEESRKLKSVIETQQIEIEKLQLVGNTQAKNLQVITNLMRENFDLSSKYTNSLQEIQQLKIFILEEKQEEKTRLNLLKERCEQLEKALQMEKEQKAQLQKQLLDTQLEKEAQIKFSTCLNKKQEETIHHLQDQISSLDQEKNKFIQLIQQQELEMESKNQEVEQQKEQIESLFNQVTDWKQQSDQTTLQQEIAELKQQVQILEQKCAELERFQPSPIVPQQSNSSENSLPICFIFPTNNNSSLLETPKQTTASHISIHSTSNSSIDTNNSTTPPVRRSLRPRSKVCYKEISIDEENLISQLQSSKRRKVGELYDPILILDSSTEEEEEDTSNSTTDAMLSLHSQNESNVL